MGIGAGKCKTTFSMEKTEWYVGEMIRVKIECDNSNSRKPVKCFKMKLLRTHSGQVDELMT